MSAQDIDIRGTAERSELQVALLESEFRLENLQERLAQLEMLTAEDQGWTLLSGDSDQEFSREGLRRIAALSRIYYLKNPLIRRSVDLQTFYVWAQGCSIQGKQSALNDVIQGFLDSPRNRRELGHEGRSAKETMLQVEGNLFFVLFPNLSTGRVKLRTVRFSEVVDIIMDPEDSTTPRYYKRVWTETRTSERTGEEEGYNTQTAYHPDWRYNPPRSLRPKLIGSAPIRWNAPIYHVKVGGLEDMRFGVPETYPSQDWAKAYTGFLGDWTTLSRAYSRFAHKLTTPGGSVGVAAAKAKLGTTLGTAGTYGEQNPPPVTGSTFISAGGVDLNPIKIGGANISAEDGRRLLLMAAAGFGWPETFYGDSKSGSLATAKSLDRPSELKIKSRQTVWADILKDLCGYALLQAVKAPNGPLVGLGRVVEDDDDGTESIEWFEDPDAKEPGTLVNGSVDVDFPPVVEHSTEEMIGAIVSAATLDGKKPAGTLDRRTIVRLLLTVLGDDDLDETLARLFPDGWENEGPWKEEEPKPEPPRPPQQPPTDPEAEPTPTVESLMLEAVREVRDTLGKLTEAA